MQRLTLDNLDSMTGLAGLADRTGVDIRPTLLRVLTDLYIQKASHSVAEDDHYTELALRLIGVVDGATCAVVAARLAGYPGAPAEVVERLAQIAPAANPSPNAERKADHPEAAVVDIWLEDDLGIFEPVTGSVATAEAQQKSPAEAAGPAPVDYIGQREAFFSADADERRLILMNLEHVAAAQTMALAQDTNIVRYLEQAALAGRIQELTTLLQQSLGTSRSLSARIVADPLGEPFVVSAKALTMPTDIFQRILMFLNPSIGHSVQRVYDLSDLFADLPLSSALHLVAVWRAADRMDSKRAVHRPVHWSEPHLPARHSTAHEGRRIGNTITRDNAGRRESSGG